MKSCFQNFCGFPAIVMIPNRGGIAPEQKVRLADACGWGFLTVAAQEKAPTKGRVEVPLLHACANTYPSGRLPTFHYRNMK